MVAKKVGRNSLGAIGLTIILYFSLTAQHGQAFDYREESRRMVPKSTPEPVISRIDTSADSSYVLLDSTVSGIHCKIYASVVSFPE